MEEAQAKVVDAYQIASQGNFDHARLILEETLYDHPTHTEAWLLLADLAEDADEARQCYQMVLENAPGNWIAQQRMKLLFSHPEESQIAESVTDALFDDELFAEPELTDPEIFSAAVLTKSPTLKESYRAHKKIIWGIGIAIAVLLIIGVISWIASVGFIVWKTGFLAWFGF